MTRPWNIVMTRILEHCDDYIIKSEKMQKQRKIVKQDKIIIV